MSEPLITPGKIDWRLQILTAVVFALMLLTNAYLVLVELPSTRSRLSEAHRQERLDAVKKEQEDRVNLLEATKRMNQSLLDNQGLIIGNQVKLVEMFRESSASKKP